VGGGTLDVVAGQRRTYGGVIDGSTGLTKTGDGKFILTGASTFTGGVNPEKWDRKLTLGVGGSLDRYQQSVRARRGDVRMFGANNQGLERLSLVKRHSYRRRVHYRHFV